MWIETDVVENLSNSCASVTYGMEIDLTQEQIESFNIKMKDKAFLIRSPQAGKPKYRNNCPFLLLWKCWPERAPLEILTPFSSKAEAIDMMSALYTHCKC